MEKEEKYLQKDILRMIFQMRKCRCEEKLIKRMIITEHDLTDYRWKSSIRKLQEAGFLETDSEEKIPALTESGTTYARQLQYAADGWNQFLQMTGGMKKQQIKMAGSWHVRYPKKRKSITCGDLSTRVEETQSQKA